MNIRDVLVNIQPLGSYKALGWHAMFMSQHDNLDDHIAGIDIKWLGVSNELELRFEREKHRKAVVDYVESKARNWGPNLGRPDRRAIESHYDYITTLLVEAFKDKWETS